MCCGARCDDLTVPEPLGPLRDLGVADGPALLGELGVCVLEDCHWADEATLDVLAYVGAADRRSAGGLLVLTFRDDELALDHPLRRVDRVDPAGRRRPRPARAAVARGRRRAGRRRTCSTRPPAATRSWSPRRSRGRAAPTVRDAVLARAARLSRGRPPRARARVGRPGADRAVAARRPRRRAPVAECERGRPAGGRGRRGAVPARAGAPGVPRVAVGRCAGSS